MPHLRIEYTHHAEAGMAELCNTLANTITAFRDSQGQQPFPTAGTRVLAHPARHCAVANGDPANAFVYVNLRIQAGRPRATVQGLGDALSAALKTHFANALAHQALGLTLQVDEGQEAYNAKLGNLHGRF